MASSWRSRRRFAPRRLVRRRDEGSPSWSHPSTSSGLLRDPGAVVARRLPARDLQVAPAPAQRIQAQPPDGADRVAQLAEAVEQRQPPPRAVRLSARAHQTAAPADRRRSTPSLPVRTSPPTLPCGRRRPDASAVRSGRPRSAPSISLVTVRNVFLASPYPGPGREPSPHSVLPQLRFTIFGVRFTLVLLRHPLQDLRGPHPPRAKCTCPTRILVS